MSHSHVISESHQLLAGIDFVDDKTMPICLSFIRDGVQIVSIAHRDGFAPS